ncbi:CLUMA_CG007781, isoform A [Clunio marinus]|uniref:CLUMA_CG007781, isoform A n=1 Tax=Clunio marinus TaxID=568069 RepID=A0A1J1I3B4_9DIPT|nr:CLUMA_CG007781, isoform A [Clunio marinus]
MKTILLNHSTILDCYEINLRLFAHISTLAITQMQTTISYSTLFMLNRCQQSNIWLDFNMKAALCVFEAMFLNSSPILPKV